MIWPDLMNGAFELVGAVFTWRNYLQLRRDRSLREGDPIDECNDDEICEIVGRTMMYSKDDPEYPVEWCYDDHGRPRCTAYIPEGMPIPMERCQHTKELF